MKCRICGKNAESEYCFQHKQRKPLPVRKTFKSPVKNETASRNISELRDFFLQIWRKRPHVSEVSGDYLGKEPLSVFFHHILPKEKYPEARLDEDNIILLTLDEHTNVETNIYKYEEVNKRRDLLKLKYESS